MKAILASNNPGKLRELNAILGGLGYEVISQREAGCTIEVEENGETFAENSLLKAKAVCEATGEITIADDSGLVVDALGGGPGVHSHRFGGPGLDDAGRTALLLEKLKEVPDEQRSARFVSVVTCCFPDGSVISAEGTVEGMIAHEPSGEKGFGYDPVFYVPEAGKTFGEFGDEEKNAISHRGRALVKLAEKLQGEQGSEGRK